MKRFVFLLIVFLLAGCAIPQEQSFDLAPTLSGSHHRQIASDLLQQLTVLYPPAKTQLSLAPAGQDSFGSLLAKDLRDQGYALNEATGTQAPPSSGLPVRYILDHPGDLYRLTLFIGTDSLSRAFALQNGALVPAGLWVHKEHGHE